MGRKAFRFLSTLIVLSTILVACSTTPTPIEPTPDGGFETVTATAIDSQTTEVPSSAPGLFDEILDTTYQTFLDNMVSYNAVSADTLVNLLDEEPPPFLLDVRSLPEVDEMGRIEGSVVIPLRDLAQVESITLLPSFDTKIITYCGSGWRCTIAMTFLAALGWRDVQTLGADSFAGWIEAGYPIVMDPPLNESLNIVQPDPALQEWINELLHDLPDGFGSVTPEILSRAIADLPDLVLIDVRRAEEVEEEGGIENAIHIPLESFILLKDKWPSSKEAKILIYSDNGYRSTIAMTMLWTYGYVGVASLNGGFNAWVESGYPIAAVVVGE